MTATCIRRESICLYGAADGEAGVRVGVDARSVTGPRGVTRYTTELLRGLVHEFPEDRFVLFVPGREPLSAVADLLAAPNVSVHRHPLPSRVLYGSAALLRRPRLERLLGEPVDVVWIPAPVPVALAGEVPSVLTLHDVAWEARPRDFTPYERLWHRLAQPRALAAGMRALIVPTAAVRDELMTRWNVDPARIHLIPEGVRLESEGAVDVAGRLGALGLQAGRYLLVSGAIEPRKAPEVIARAFAAARQRGLDAELVFAGDGRLAGAVAGPGVRVLGWKGTADLEAIYRGAIALVFASRLEGFALPVYESLARGTPAIVTDLPVFGAELSPGLIRVVLDDEGALGAAMLRLAGDRALRQQLGDAGQRAVSGLTWERAARATRDVFVQTLARE
jgi:glycosyltransferase involved in cell wall biosynthesis